MQVIWFYNGSPLFPYGYVNSFPNSDSSKRAGLVQWLLMLFVFRRHIVPLLVSVRLGLLPLVCRVWCLLVPPGLAVV